MTSDGHLMRFLAEAGHAVEGEWADEVQALAPYEVDELDPPSLVGFAVHSYLSGRPRANFFTDGKHLFTTRDKTLRGTYGLFRPADLPRAYLEDALREDEILTILRARPEGPCDLYAIVNGHLRLRQFGSAFADPSEYATPTGYDMFRGYLAALLPAKTIVADERAAISRRLARSRGLLDRLVHALAKDGDPYPHYAAILEASLAPYSSAPLRRATP